MISPLKKSGSSPRVRGTLALLITQINGWRFIPAGAGNTSETPRRCMLRAVHPRGCGEHLKMPFFKSSFNGSSPRVRGTLSHPDSIDQIRRFIPAGAGNTLVKALAATKGAVHPRGCGEHVVRPPVWLLVPGSSPRVRGTLSSCWLPGRTRRFIPAGAGNTHSIENCGLEASVHPRGCGEHQFSTFNRLRRFGSSPRVRGTRFRIHWKTKFTRFIPAGAGNT